MSDENGTVTRPAVTSGYKPTIFMARQWNFLDGDQWFTLRDADIMRRDPFIRMGLRAISAPLKGVQFKVTAQQPVAEFVKRTITAIWKRYLNQILKMLVYGFQGGEAELVARNGMIEFSRWIPWHYADLKPQEYKTGSMRGELAGSQVRMKTPAGNRIVFVDRRHLLWFVSESEYNGIYGQSRLSGSYLPWREMRGRHGAVPSRQLWYGKNAFDGGVLRHPPGSQRIDATTVISNQDYAREVLEKKMNGGTLILPNERDGDGKEYAWFYEAPKMNSAATDFRDYVLDLGHEIWLGMGIPPELIQASERGSGFSGRSIPALTFYSSEDDIVSDAVSCIEQQLIRPLVDLNFGEGTPYEIEPTSLVEQLKNIDNPNAIADEEGGGQDGDDPFAQGADLGLRLSVVS